jgi:SOS-response transcriptional repressor LexA
MKELTQRQAEILAFIKAHYREKGYAPTLREIGARFGLKSTNGITDHLRALERKGALCRDPMKSRAIVPVEMGEGVRPAPTVVDDEDPFHIVHVDVVNISDLVRGTGDVETLRIDRKLLSPDSRLPATRLPR